MDVLQFTLENETYRFSAYNIYYCHDTGHSFKPIFLKFTWLVRVHTWVNPILSCHPTNGFLQFFQHKLKNIREVFLLERILIQKKILWRINFVLIKFLPNALLLEKLQNEFKNLSFLHKVTCIRLDHAGAVAKYHIRGFIL